MTGPEGAEKLEAVTVFSAQTPEQQMLVFQPAAPGVRKVRYIPWSQGHIWSKDIARPQEGCEFDPVVAS